MNKQFRCRFAALVLAMSAGVAQADSAVIDRSFYPYQTEKPAFAGLSAGLASQPVLRSEGRDADASGTRPAALQLAFRQQPIDVRLRRAQEPRDLRNLQSLVVRDSVQAVDKLGRLGDRQGQGIAVGHQDATLVSRYRER